MGSSKKIIFRAIVHMGACISKTEEVVIEEFKTVILPVIVEELTKELKKITVSIPDELLASTRTCEIIPIGPSGCDATKITEA
jgi:hypothetical protein